MMDEDKEDKQLFNIFLIGCIVIYIFTYSVGISNSCDSSPHLIFFSFIFGFPWSLAFLDLFEGWLKHIPSLINPSMLCLGPLDNLAYSFSIIINWMLTLLVYRFLTDRNR